MNNPNISKAGLLTSMSRKTKATWMIALAAAALLWPLARAQAEVYRFNLGPANTAKNPSSGDTIRMTGAGVFDTDLGGVAAQGAFAILDSDGKVVARGTWAATAFESFLSLGGPNHGLQGGVLEIIITLFPKGGAPIPNQLMTVVCPFEEAEGEFHEDEDGTTVGDFTEITGGITVFHLMQ